MDEIRLQRETITQLENDLEHQTRLAIRLTTLLIKMDCGMEAAAIVGREAVEAISQRMKEEQKTLEHNSD